MKNPTSFLFILFVLTLASCNSPLSTGTVEEIAMIGATIDIYQSPTDKNDNGISIDLFDHKNNSIRNDSITIFVNGVEGILYHHQGLYYTDESHYVLSDIPINDAYNVAIKLTDGKKYPLGTVQALSEEKIENIDCDEQGDFNKNTVVKWKDLKSIDELSIFTSTILKTSTEKMINCAYKDEIVKKIGSNGEIIFPKSDYMDAKETVTGFELKFRTTKFGEINPKLLEHSKISISTSIEKNINLRKE